LSPGRATRWSVPEEAAGRRLDRALAEHLELPRSRVQRWIREGCVRVDGALAVKTGAALAVGSEVSWDPPAAITEALEPETGDLALLAVDDEFVLVDKPAGLVVHPGAGRASGTLVHRLLARFPDLAAVGGPGRPGIVHRLDKGTSGALVVARTADAYSRLSGDFAARRVRKRYLALVWGRPRVSAGTIDAAIGRHRADRKRMTVRAGGRPARTGWRLLAVAGPISLLELDLETGRTHQIRVHLRVLGHPLVGDPVYGEARHRGLRGETARALAEFGRPALHARSLAFAHPRSGEPLRFVAPLPADLVRLWESCGGGSLGAVLARQEGR